MTRHEQNIAAILDQLGVPPGYMAVCKLPLQPEAVTLAEAGRDMFGRPQRMMPQTLQCWQRMQHAALADGVELLLVSAFRSVDYQFNLIKAKLERGQTLDEILKVNTAPGYSEHHTGRALDLATPGQEPLTEAFETTEAFDWLTRRAGEFSFSLSYPRDNPYGIIYEPWHWANHQR